MFEHARVCVFCACVFCRWLEEPAASGSVRKHLIRDGVEKEREEGRKRKQRGRDEGGDAGRSAEYLPHLLSTSSCLPLPSACMPKLSPPNRPLICFYYTESSRKTQGFLVSSFSALFFSPAALFYYNDKCSAIPLCSLRVQCSGQKKKNEHFK